MSEAPDLSNLPLKYRIMIKYAQFMDGISFQTFLAFLITLTLGLGILYVEGDLIQSWGWLVGSVAMFNLAFYERNNYHLTSRQRFSDMYCVELEKFITFQSSKGLFDNPLHPSVVKNIWSTEAPGALWSTETKDKDKE